MSLDKIKVQKISQNLIGRFDPGAKCEVLINAAGCHLDIESDSSGILIGRRGETLQALQHILRLVLSHELEEFVPIIVDISGYRAGREEEIIREAKELALKVQASGAQEQMAPMTGYERRLVHLALEGVDGIQTESVGEGSERRIVIKKK